MITRIMRPNRQMTVTPATRSSIIRASQALRNGELVAFPTETVYGLGGDATNADAVARIFEMKGRPHFNPLIVHVADRETAASHVEFNESANRLATAFWPGPLTLVLTKKPESEICDLVSAGLETIGIRVPLNPVAQELLQTAGLPVAAPSANLAGRISPTRASHVQDDLGDGPALILDGDFAAIGLESTVIGFSDDTPLLLRPGGIPGKDIEKVLGKKLEGAETGHAPTSPGQLESHYAPRAAIRLNATDVKKGEALMSFGNRQPETDGPSVNLSPDGSLREAAIHFFAALRELDASGCKTIAVVPIPDEGLGEAINDRLRRAAAPRP